MRNQRRFPPELKRSAVEELLSQTSSPAQICRRYNISSGLLYHWKRQYARGKFGNEPTREAALADRVEKLERLVGQLSLEKELLKKALTHTLEKADRKENSFSFTSTGSKESKGVAVHESCAKQFLLFPLRRNLLLDRIRRRFSRDGLKPSAWSFPAMATGG